MATTLQKMTGKVKFYNEKKGFGFITGTDDVDYFVHVTQLPKDQDVPKPGEEVSFDIKDTPKGQQAVDITYL